jgi:dipeptidyl aminopeptidase/acylaminoacyl peptidase
MLRLRTRAVAAALWLCMAAGTVQATPIEAYGRLPAMESVTLSPDGSTLAVIVTVGDQRRIIVRRLDGVTLAQIELGERKVRGVQWAGADHVIISISRTTGISGVAQRGEFYQAVSLNVRTGKYIQLPVRSTDSVINVLAGSITTGVVAGEETAFTTLVNTVANNLQGDSIHIDFFRIGLDSGKAVRLQMGDADTEEFLTQSDGTVVAKVSAKNRGREGDVLYWIEIKRGSGWQKVFETTLADESPSLFGLSPDGQSVIVTTWDEAENLWRPTPISLADGKRGDFIGPAVAQGAIVDDQNRVLAYTRRGAFLEYDFVEPRLRAAWPMVRGAFKERQVTLTSWSADFSKLVLYVDAGAGSPGYYLFDVTAKRVTPLGSDYPGVAPTEVAEVRPVYYTAADGMPIEAYLTLPRGREAKGLPLVVLPHGGPRARDAAGFDWIAQGLASRGYAVLQANFRGSTGYGRAFKRAGYGEWGGKMQTDLSDGVAWLAKEGVVDAKRACILGASYGGYAALAGVTLEQGVYRCAVSIAGVADLPKMMSDDLLNYGTTSARLRDERRLFGVEQPNDPKLAARSPAQQAAKANAPILLIHGRDDTVVEYVHSTTMQRALQAAGKPVELVTLPGEDHWLSRSATRLQTLNAAVTFLEKHNPPN